MHDKVLFCWSGGKDSAMALYEIVTSGKYDIEGLLTTVTKDYDRISMHGVRRPLLKKQAEALGFPLEEVFISKESSNEEYEINMQTALEKFTARGVSKTVFGDVFLEDVRKYREDQLARIKMTAAFPLWKRDTQEMVHTFIDLGFRAVVTCVDGEALPKKFVGRNIDKQFVEALPQGVDPCGENGEYHSFVYDGPIFSEKISFSLGEIILRDDRFYFCDLLIP